MDPNHFTEVAAQASERYQTVLTTFRGMLFGYLNEAFSASRADELRSNAVEVGRLYFQTEARTISEEVRATAIDALQSAQRDMKVNIARSIPSALTDQLEATIDYLKSELRAQLSRDVEMVVRRYREFALEAQLEGRARAALNSDRSRFTFRDRAGRLYPSQKFVRSAWRQTLVVTAAEFYALEAASLGAKIVEVVHPDPHASISGEKISLTGDFSPTFSEVRDEVFHPQSLATLKVVDVPAQ